MRISKYINFKQEYSPLLFLAWANLISRHSVGFSSESVAILMNRLSTGYLLKILLKHENITPDDVRILDKYIHNFDNRQHDGFMINREDLLVAEKILDYVYDNDEVDFNLKKALLDKNPTLDDIETILKAYYLYSHIQNFDVYNDVNNKYHFKAHEYEYHTGGDRISELVMITDNVRYYYEDEGKSRIEGITPTGDTIVCYLRGSYALIKYEVVKLKGSVYSKRDYKGYNEFILNNVRISFDDNAERMFKIKTFLNT